VMEGSARDIEEGKESTSHDPLQCLDSFILGKIISLCDAPFMKVLCFVSHKWKTLAKSCFADNTIRLMEYAVRKGHLGLIKWARENGCPWYHFAGRHAALNGHLEVLKHIKLFYFLEKSSVDICANAALNGHLGVLKWAREDGCAWNESTCLNAALNGHLGVLKWARENGCPWNENTCSCAALRGHLETLKWAREWMPLGSNYILGS